ncbi:sugar nucleotide-binding protein [Dasania sp. GY-MA-18]|uniref:Sugar nucleotide-binding protein n=1 Tax=Dasania phycosphaerae TaxID=2950436 RepID=A0A9J6RIJ0_9GAMM|nr:MULTISPECIES: sugar nucleotide-binding protein [Dasania]MCR8921377.1 sugar nucleotide-binding protein [Dasania sp. GY-MA-18]MCZ0863805.1 sugar nucleotide-binding protein [Dasania phycosphaerae]MCZ0867533.1 sugar nucleotide-binding protein [Dasania phycosphaerae]
MKILVAGASGLLGSYLLPFLRRQIGDNKTITSDCEVIGQAYKNLKDAGFIQADFTKKNDVKRVLDQIKPDLIINLICLSDVDLCERDINLSYALNVSVVESIVDWLVKNDSSHLIQISTDHVYDSPGLNKEGEVIIRNQYAFSKYAGELSALMAGATVLRTNFFGNSLCDRRKSFSDWVISSCKSKLDIELFSDVMFNPLSMQTLSEMICKVVESPVAGVFNLGSNKGMSKSDFSFFLADSLQLNSDCLREASFEQVKTRLGLTARPKDMLMNVEKFERAFNVSLPTLEDEILTLSI